MRSRAARAIGAALLAVTVTLAPLLGAAPTAVAATDTAQANLDYWWSAYGIDAAHDAGLTGKGVKVAILEQQINPDLPIFEGRSLRVSDKPVCAEDPPVATTDANPSSRHGTTMTALIIGNGEGADGIRGIAPDADVTFYGYGSGNCTPDIEEQISPFGYGVKLAVDGGAKIIFTSIGGTAQEGDGPAIAYAIARGAVVISASDNPDSTSDSVGFSPLTDQGTINGVVSAAAIDRNADLQKTDAGDPYVIPQTTVVAGGVRFPSVGRDGDWTTSGTASGSSYASPTVAGMLTLAAQKFPDATGNQLVQALISTTNGQQHEPARTEDGYGYGAAWLPTLLVSDPTALPDENPLMGESAGKTTGYPTSEQIEAAKAGGFVVAVESPRPRSFNEDGDASAAGSDMSAVIGWVVGGVAVLLVIAVIVTLVIVITIRRRKAGEGTHS
ncbi:S8 family serine peptidase [Microbacterium sp. BWR-S6Y]|uniref:S8 family peptidase n=1 Tax=Microbacterium sp. BWR-S6Y TaxID=3232073 RepID=UPI003529A19D